MELLLRLTIGLVDNIHTIDIDMAKNQLNVLLTEDELEQRRKEFVAPKIKYQSGVLAKYAKLVGSASKGAVTD